MKMKMCPSIKWMQAEQKKTTTCIHVEMQYLTCFTNSVVFHFILFYFIQFFCCWWCCRRFNLIESKETDVLRDLEIALRLTDDPVLPSQQQSASSATIPNTIELNSQQTSTNLTTIHTMSSTTSAAISAATGKPNIFKHPFGCGYLSPY